MDLLERDVPLAQLAACLERARQGEGNVVVVRGEAGIGKTSLLKTFVENINPETLLWGNCDDLLTPQPLEPFADMSVVEPELGPASKNGDVSGVFRTLLELMNRSLRPPVVVIEDIHDADLATLDVITGVSRRIGSTNGLLVVTMREEGAADSPVWRTVGALAPETTTQIRLERLSEGAIAGWVGAQRARRATELTGGNPFLLNELFTDDDAAVSTVAGVMRGRLSKLTAAARSLVELVSVVPGRAEVSLIEAADESALKGLDEAEEAGILISSSTDVSFHHELSRQAVESDLSGAARRQLNDLILAGGIGIGLDPARLGHHARQAQDRGACLTYLPVAARGAAKAGSYEEALHHLDGLAGMLDELEPEQRAELLELRARIEISFNGRGLVPALEAMDLREASAPNTDETIRSILLASRAASYDNDRELARNLAERALGGAVDTSGEVLAEAYAELSRLAMMDSDYRQSIELGKRALATTSAPSQAAANALNNIGVSKGLFEYPEGVSELEESMRIGSELGLEVEYARASENLISLAQEWWDLDFSSKIVQAGQWNERPSLDRSLEVHLMPGDLDAGRLTHVYETGKALQDATDRHRIDLIAATGYTAEAAMMLGKTDGPALLNEIVDLAEGNGQAQYLSLAAIALGKWAHYSGDESRVDFCLAVYDRALDLGLPGFIGRLGFWLWLTGAIHELDSRAPEPLIWATTGRARNAGQWFEERGAHVFAAFSYDLGDNESRLKALSMFDRMGARPDADRIRRSLRGAGVTGIPRAPSPSTAPDPMGLTRRQREVFELLQQGFTNTEIGERLFISHRTVEKHVATILQVVGVDTRRDLVRSATVS